jgi:hypothetical protein
LDAVEETIAVLAVVPEDTPDHFPITAGAMQGPDLPPPARELQQQV